MRAAAGLLLLFFWALPVRAEYLKMALKELSLVKGASLFVERAEESPFPVTVITSEERWRFGWFNLRDLLEYQPSFYLIQDVNERVVAHRGLYRTVTSHLLFLEDGFKLHLPMMENFIADASFPLTGISRIEIIRGPGASLYGDAALTGVINLERRNFPRRAALSLGLGEYDSETGDLALSLPAFGQGCFHLLFHYADLPGEILRTDQGSQRLHPRPENYAVKLEWEGGPWALFYFRIHSRYDTPRSQLGVFLSSEDLKPFGSREEVWQDLAGFSRRLNFGGFEGTLRLFWGYFEASTPQIRTTHAEGNFTAFDIDLAARRWGLAGHFHRRHRRGTFLFGGKWERKNYEQARVEVFSGGRFSTLTDLPPETEDNWALFVQEKFHLLPELVLNAGLRYDHYESFGGHLSPRVSLIWNPVPAWSFLAAWGEAFQAPNYFYRGVNLESGYGGKDLDSETVRTLIFSLLRRFGERSLLRMTFFREDFRDLLEKEKFYRNLGHLELSGVEAEFRWFSENLLAFLNYSLYEVIKAEDTGLAFGNRVEALPRWMVKGGVSFRLLPRLYFSPQFRLYGRARWQGDWLSPYAVWDLHLLYRHRNLWFSLKVENLFDHHFERAGTTPPYSWPGRSVFLRLGVEF